MFLSSQVRVIAALVFSLMILIIAGCGDDTSGDVISEPAQVVHDFVKASNEYDCEKLFELIDYSELNAAGGAVSTEEEREKCRREKEQNPQPAQTIPEYKILEEKIDGDRAELKVEMTTKTGNGEDTATVPLILKKTGGKWRIVIGPL